MRHGFLFLAFLFLLPLAAPAQMATTDTSMRNFKRGSAITLFSAVGGGILGLSTLSFYGEPREHTSNITNGALLGLAFGLGYVIWENTREPSPTRWGLLPMKDGAILACGLGF